MMRLMKLPFDVRFHPRVLDATKDYNRERFMQDLGAGLTVAVVALPLAMAFAIASGLPPQAGLWTAVIGGFLVSLLGGSSVQIGGPAGAFIVIVYGIIERYGVANLLIATAMSGVFLFLMGVFKLGTLIRFIPVAVVTGFTNGIAVLIGLSQLKDFLGLKVDNMPANFFGMAKALWGAVHTFNLTAFLLAIGSLAVIVGWAQMSTRMGDRLRGVQRLPGSIVALVLATVVVAVFHLPVETIGSKFGGIPSSPPGFTWPKLEWETARFLLIPALTLAMLGAIESLLCARVADGMIGGRHDPNQELMAQGVANVVVPFLGGMPVTGTIARTVTNIKNGGRTPVAGMLHAVVLAAIILLAAPLASHVPLAVLAAILMFVAWNMGEWRAFAHLRQYRMPYRLTLVSVFLLTVIFDLTVAVEVGLVAACLTFIYRISSLSRSEAVTAATHPALAGHEGRVQVWRLYGALFFGAVKLVEVLEDNLPSRTLVLDLKNLIYVDSSGADALDNLARTCARKGVQLIITGLVHQPLDIARRTGLIDLLPVPPLDDVAAGVALATAPREVAL